MWTIWPQWQSSELHSLFVSWLVNTHVCKQTASWSVDTCWQDVDPVALSHKYVKILGNVVYRPLLLLAVSTVWRGCWCSLAPPLWPHDWLSCHVVYPALSLTGQCAQSPFCTLTTVFRYVPLCTITTRPQWPRNDTESSACSGTGSPVHSRSSAPNAFGTGGFSGGDAERRYRQGQAEARQPLADPPHQNSAADVKHGEPQTSVHVLDAGLFRAGERAVEDCHVIL